MLIEKKPLLKKINGLKSVATKYIVPPELYKRNVIKRVVDSTHIVGMDFNPSYAINYPYRVLDALLFASTKNIYLETSRNYAA